MTLKRLLAIALAAVAAVVLFVALRPAGDEEDDVDAAEPTATRSTATRTTETRAATTTTLPRRPDVVRINVRGGRPLGGARKLSVRRGATVRIVVTADVADHVHVHGFDLMRDVRPGRPARFRFRARLVGRFEIELEDRGLPIAELEVRP